MSAAVRGGVPDGVAVTEAREGPFHLTIVEAGTLQALRSMSYASAIQSNQAKIVAIVPEGKMVAKGDPPTPAKIPRRPAAGAFARRASEGRNGR